MIHSFYEVKIRYEKVMDNGMTRNVTEPYLVDALSFTEAEARTIQEVTPYISGEFTIRAIKLVPYSELINMDEEDGFFYAVKMVFVTLDEKTGSEKKTPNYVLVKAKDENKVLPLVHEAMKGSMSDYQVERITKTAIEDVFVYEVPAKTTSEK